MNTKDTFANEGLRPQGLAPPAVVVRAWLPGGRRLVQYLGLALWLTLGIIAALAVAMWSPAPLPWLAIAVLVGFAANAYVLVGEDYRSIELEGDLLRAEHLYTGSMVERRISEIEELKTITYGQVGGGEVQAIEAVLLGRVKGVDIRFRGERSGWRVLRSDPEMIGALELLEGVMYRMAQVGPLVAEMAAGPGPPLVRRVVWRDAVASDSTTLTPDAPRRPDRKVQLALLNAAGLMLGVIFCLLAGQEAERRRIGLMPAIEIPLAKLLAEGVGENRHVTLTRFEAGGFTVEKRDGHWIEVWAALFPQGAARSEIQMVFSSRTIFDEAMLRGTLGGGRVTGICSATPSSSWGVTLGPNLVQSNQGIPLKAAWKLEELRSPPSEEWVLGIMVAAALAFVWVLVASGLIFWT